MPEPTVPTSLGERTVQEIVGNCPAALPVFHAFGIDACCGGALPLREAAARHGVSLSEVAAALREAEEGGT